MKYCSQCGKPLENNARFCPFCGARSEVFSSMSMLPRSTGRNRKIPLSQRIRVFLKRTFPVVDHTASYTQDDRKMNGSIALLSYLHILLLVPAVSMKESRFTQYHVKLGKNLLFYQILAELLSWLLLHAFGWIPVLNILIYTAVIAANLALWGIAVFGIVTAARGKAEEFEHLQRFYLFS